MRRALAPGHCPRQEFRTPDGGSRVAGGYSVFGDNSTADCNGHGTHTAATVGGVTYGVAKNVTLWAVRAMDCAGNAQVRCWQQMEGTSWAAGRLPFSPSPPPSRPNPIPLALAGL